MSFYESLIARSSGERQQMLDIPLIQRALRGDVSLVEYQAFLGQAYHHVKHTVPLLMACGARLPGHLDWLRAALAHYIAEEIGHEEWILDDLAASGGDPDAVRRSSPAPATEVMVAYAYDQIQRRNPVGFLGMVYVLEGTSVSLAHHAAGALVLRAPDAVRGAHQLRRLRRAQGLPRAHDRDDARGGLALLR